MERGVNGGRQSSAAVCWVRRRRSDALQKHFIQRKTMRISGKRVHRTRLVRTDRYVVAVEVEAVIPDADPSEPCFEPDTVELLREIEKRARQGDVAWLRRHGKVYAAVDAA